MTGKPGLKIAMGKECLHPWRSIVVKTDLTHKEPPRLTLTCADCGASVEGCYVAPMIWLKLHERIDELAEAVVLAEGVQARMDRLTERIAVIESQLVAAHDAKTEKKIAAAD